MSNTVALIVGATVTLVGLYLFVNERSRSSEVISSLAGAYSQSVRALQGR